MTTDIKFYRLMRNIVSVTMEIKNNPYYLRDYSHEELLQFADRLENLAKSVRQWTETQVELAKVRHPTRRGIF